MTRGNPLHHDPIHEAAARAYIKLTGEPPLPDDLPALALAEWALLHPQGPRYHGLSETNAEMLLSELQDRMSHDSFEAQHRFLTTCPHDEPENPDGPHHLRDIAIPDPFLLHRMEPDDLARYMVDVLNSKLAAMDVGYPVAVSHEWHRL